MKNRKRGFIEVEKIEGIMADSDETQMMDEREELLHRSLARLEPEQRELLVLTRFQHLKYEEVAAIMNTTVANIKVRVHRAIGKLREYYFEMEKI
jgi:RNA polymerase sigma factor (sigma-70 family)